MELVDTFSNRLKKAMDINDMKQVDLVEKTGLDKTLINKYLVGITNARQKKLSILAEALNVNEVWLMGYDVEMQRESIVSNVAPLPDIPIKIPVLGKISAGLPLLAEENLIGYDFAPSSNIKKGFDYFYLIVTGDSMNLKFKNGDRVLVQKQDYLENGEIGAIMVNGSDATVKKFRTENDIIILEPMSTNPEHHVQLYNPKNVPIRIIGKVVLYIGNVN